MIHAKIDIIFIELLIQRYSSLYYKLFITSLKPSNNFTLHANNIYIYVYICLKNAVIKCGKIMTIAAAFMEKKAGCVPIETFYAATTTILQLQR